MAWNDVVSLKKLSVRLESDDRTANIYGNGRNQIGVVVSVEGLDKDRNPVSLTSDEIIPHTQLVDALTGEKLNLKEDKGWNYTDIVNQYHTIPSGGRSRRDAGGTTAKYYVQCHPDERLRTKSIAVKAFLSNPSAEKKEYSTGEHGTPGFNSKVQITSLEKKDHYTMDHMNVEMENVNEGINEFYRISWDQDNYYFSIKESGFYIKHAEISHYNGNEGAYQVSKNAFYNRFPRRGAFALENVFNVGYIWEMSNHEQTKNVALYINKKGFIYGDLHVNITVNQKPNSLCLTRMRYLDNQQEFMMPSFWNDRAIKSENLSMQFNANITIYDQYGNMSKFHAIPEPSDDMHLGNKIQILNRHH